LFTKSKVVLLMRFCLCVYGLALWKYYSVTALNKIINLSRLCLTSGVGIA